VIARFLAAERRIAYRLASPILNATSRIKAESAEWIGHLSPGRRRGRRNGFWQRRGDRGIDPAPASQRQLGILPGLQVNQFTRSQFPLIDGLVPSGAAPISSTGIVIQTRAPMGKVDYIQAAKSWARYGVGRRNDYAAALMR